MRNRCKCCSDRITITRAATINANLLNMYVGAESHGYSKQMQESMFVPDTRCFRRVPPSVAFGFAAVQSVCVCSVLHQKPLNNERENAAGLLST